MCKPIDSAEFYLITSLVTFCICCCSRRTNSFKAVASTVTYYCFYYYHHYYCFYYYHYCGGWCKQMTDTLMLKIVLIVWFGIATEAAVVIIEFVVLLLSAVPIFFSHCWLFNSHIFSSPFKNYYLSPLPLSGFYSYYTTNYSIPNSCTLHTYAYVYIGSCSEKCFIKDIWQERFLINKKQFV